MPFDMTPQETKQDVFTVESLATWLRTQDPETEYCYMDTGGCLLHRYFTACGIPLASQNAVWGEQYTTEDGKVHNIPYDLSVVPIITCANTCGTYGAALKRAEAILKKRNA